MYPKRSISKGLFAVAALLLSIQAFAEYSAGTAGGPHGNYSSGQCAGDEWPIGLTVGGGTYLHNIYLQCAKRSNLREVRQVRVVYTASLGDYYGFGNRKEETKFCPEGYALAGVKLQAGSYVDRMNSMRCQLINGTNLKYPGVAIGGGGGSTARLYCRGGDTVTKIEVRKGQWIDQLQVFCG